MFKPVRVVVYGHRPRNFRKRILRLRPRRYDLTYVFEGYVRAFESLGYDTHWIEEGVTIDDTFLTGALVLTEDQVDDRLPKSQEARYVVHSSDGSKYFGRVGGFLHLRNFTIGLLAGSSLDFPGGNPERINDFTYYDAKNSVLYQPWATDLLPNEIQVDNVVRFDPSRPAINYVGTVDHDNIRSHLEPFAASAAAAGKRLNVVSGLTSEQARTVTRSSLISVDIRGDWHRSIGYIPCRIWKTLSYGTAVSSNSPLLNSVLGEYVNFVSNSEDLFASALDWHSSQSPRQLMAATSFVRERHTFVNRAQSIIECLGYN